MSAQPMSLYLREGLPEWMSRTKEPCQTEGCNWPNWHICLVDQPDLFPEILRSRAARGHNLGRTLSQRSDSHRAAISEANTARWAEKNAERNAKIISRYNEGTVGIRTIAAEFGITYQTVARALKQAEEEGLVKIRKQGESPESVLKARAEKQRAQEKPLADAVVERYNASPISIRDLGKAFGIGVEKTTRILREAANEGRTVLRATGQNISRGY